jgi:hypothetical protein
MGISEPARHEIIWKLRKLYNEKCYSYMKENI